MDEKTKKKLADPEVYYDMLRGATMALAYTDEEIREMFEEPDAQEFIDQRNKVLKELKPYKHKFRIDPETCRLVFIDDEDETPIAAEDEAPYSK